MSTPTAPLYSILRIKRKRTTSQQPLDALVIDDAVPSSKRRRQQAPAVQSSQPRGIFRFAETVPIDSFTNVAKTRQLKDRITAFLTHPPSAALSRVSSTGSLPSRVSSPSAPSSPSTRKPPSLRTRAATGADSPKEQRLQERVKGFHEESKRARYRIVQRQRSTAEGLSSAVRSQREDMSAGARGGARPPVVMAAADLARAAALAADQTRIYDAAEEEHPESKRAHILSSRSDDVEMSSQFASMLEEYLTLQDSTSSARAPASGPLQSSSIAPPPVDLSAPSLDQPIDLIEEGDEEFVYDVYYRDLRETASDPRTLAGHGGAGASDVGSMAGLKRVGELAGLEDDELLNDGGDVSDEEVDEDDQDSNEENDYRNDYPDGEDQEESDEGSADDFDESDSDQEVERWSE